jgi:hypothetical protein
MLTNPLSERLAAFVRGIGIRVDEVTLDDPTFLPGLDIRYGALLLDEERLSYPGDILHEAGHIAVGSPEERRLEKIDPTPGDEMTAIAWSWAALRHLDIPPEVVFHPAGYKGGSQAIIENFSEGRYFGVPLLQLYEMAVESRFASERSVEPYPHMLRWLR